MRGKGQGKSTSKMAQFWLSVAPFFNHNGVKKAGCPIFNQEKQGQNSSNPARIRQAATEDVKQKNPEKPQFFGVFEHL